MDFYTRTREDGNLSFFLYDLKKLFMKLGYQFIIKHRPALSFFLPLIKQPICLHLLLRNVIPIQIHGDYYIQQSFSTLQSEKQALLRALILS